MQLAPSKPILTSQHKCRTGCSSSAADHGSAAAIQNLQDENMALRNTLQQMSLLALPSELTSGQVTKQYSCRALHNRSAVASLFHVTCSLKMEMNQTGAANGKERLAHIGPKLSLMIWPPVGQTSTEAPVMQLSESTRHTLTHMASLASTER